jgi:Uma2 family endonuclease
MPLLLMTTPTMTTGTGRIPELSPGDRLTRPEFERRYQAMPQVKKAELIEGVVYMPSPVSYVRHAEPHALLSLWLSLYAADTPGTGVGDNATVRLDLDNEPQPDLLLRIRTGGSSVLGPDGYLEGPPEFVAEVAASSVSYDLHDKRNAYRRNGVQEYLVWRADETALDWFVLRSGRYERLVPDATGVLRSEVFPGLWLDGDALFLRDAQRLRAVLQQGIDSTPHASFVARLAHPG